MSNSMSRSKIAIFGATGGTGSATLRSLLSKDAKPFHLRLFVRSKAKLYRLFPELEKSANVEVWEGQLDEVAAITECLRGADIVICTLGENQNIPGLSVLQTGSKSIVSALDFLSQEESFTKPRLLLLSSTTLERRFAAHQPKALLWIVERAFCYPYDDVRGATTNFKAVPQLLSLLVVHPPAIVEDEPTGHQISTEKVRPIVSYADLGSAFAELALETSYDELHFVGVSSLGGDAVGKYALELFSRMIIGLISGWVPGYWPAKNYLGW